MREASVMARITARVTLGCALFGANTSSVWAPIPHQDAKQRVRALAALFAPFTLAQEQAQ